LPLRAFSFLTGIRSATRFTAEFHDVEIREIRMKEKRTTSVQSIERGLTILEALSGESGGLGVAELARRTRLPASTVHRLLSVFVRRGYVQRGGARCSYRIDPRFLGLGLLPVQLFREIHRLVAERFLARFAAGEVAGLFVKIGDRSLCVRPGRSREGRGRWLVPEVSEASKRVCPWIAESVAPGDCVVLSGAADGSLFRAGAGEDAWCTCVPVRRRNGRGRIDKIGVRGVEVPRPREVLAMSQELGAMAAEMKKMMRDGLGRDAAATTSSPDRPGWEAGR
jgi:DNA-binding Lrp family transcriptional regulator